jgi:hypothetical protein
VSRVLQYAIAYSAIIVSWLVATRYWQPRLERLVISLWNTYIHTQFRCYPLKNYSSKKKSRGSLGNTYSFLFFLSYSWWYAYLHFYSQQLSKVSSIHTLLKYEVICTYIVFVQCIICDYCGINWLKVRGMTFARDVRKQLSQIMQKIAEGLYLHFSWSIFI